MSYYILTHSRHKKLYIYKREKQLEKKRRKKGLQKRLERGNLLGCSVNVFYYIYSYI